MKIRIYHQNAENAFFNNKYSEIAKDFSISRVYIIKGENWKSNYEQKKAHSCVCV